MSGQRVIQRQVLYLGEINDSQKAEWSEAVEVFDEADRTTKQVALFPEHRQVPVLDCDVITIRLSTPIRNYSDVFRDGIFRCGAAL